MTTVSPSRTTVHVSVPVSPVSDEDGGTAPAVRTRSRMVGTTHLRPSTGAMSVPGLRDARAEPLAHRAEAFADRVHVGRSRVHLDAPVDEHDHAVGQSF